VNVTTAVPVLSSPLLALQPVPIAAGISSFTLQKHRRHHWPRLKILAAAAVLVHALSCTGWKQKIEEKDRQNWKK
jgi:hypothetical protein